MYMKYIYIYRVSRFYTLLPALAAVFAHPDCTAIEPFRTVSLHGLKQLQAANKYYLDVPHYVEEAGIWS